LIPAETIPDPNWFKVQSILIQLDSNCCNPVQSDFNRLELNKKKSNNNKNSFIIQLKIKSWHNLMRHCQVKSDAHLRVGRRLSPRRLTRHRPSAIVSRRAIGRHRPVPIRLGG